MKTYNLTFLAIIIVLCSCHTSSNDTRPESPSAAIPVKLNDAKPENVIQEYWAASNEKDINKITTLLYHGIYTDVSKEDVINTYHDLLTTGSVNVSNISYAGNPIALDTMATRHTMAQKYFLDTELRIDKASDKEFEQLKMIYLNQDPNAIISEEDKSIKFRSKKKLLIIEDDKGTFILPDMYFSSINMDSLGLMKTLKSYQAIP